MSLVLGDIGFINAIDLHRSKSVQVGPVLERLDHQRIISLSCSQPQLHLRVVRNHQFEAFWSLNAGPKPYVSWYLLEVGRHTRHPPSVTPELHITGLDKTINCNIFKQSFGHLAPLLKPLPLQVLRNNRMVSDVLLKRQLAGAGPTRLLINRRLT